MDNVLIDERRIHVDFSQSVAKMVHNKPGMYCILSQYSVVECNVVKTASCSVVVVQCGVI